MVAEKIMLAPIAILGAHELVQSGAEGVVLAAAATAALGYLWKKVIRPARAFAKRIHTGIDHLETLPAFRKEVRTRFEVIEGVLYGTDVSTSLPIRRRGDPPS